MSRPSKDNPGFPGSNGVGPFLNGIGGKRVQGTYNDGTPSRKQMVSYGAPKTGTRYPDGSIVFDEKQAHSSFFTGKMKPGTRVDVEKVKSKHKKRRHRKPATDRTDVSGSESGTESGAEAENEGEDGSIEEYGEVDELMSAHEQGAGHRAATPIALPPPPSAPPSATNSANNRRPSTVVSGTTTSSRATASSYIASQIQTEPLPDRSKTEVKRLPRQSDRNSDAAHSRHSSNKDSKAPSKTHTSRPASIKEPAENSARPKSSGKSHHSTHVSSNKDPIEDDRSQVSGRTHRSHTTHRTHATDKKAPSDIAPARSSHSGSTSAMGSNAKTETKVSKPHSKTTNKSDMQAIPEGTVIEEFDEAEESGTENESSSSGSESGDDDSMVSLSTVAANDSISQVGPRKIKERQRKLREKVVAQEKRKSDKRKSSSSSSSRREGESRSEQKDGDGRKKKSSRSTGNAGSSSQGPFSENGVRPAVSVTKPDGVDKEKKKKRRSSGTA